MDFDGENTVFGLSQFIELLRKSSATSQLTVRHILVSKGNNYISTIARVMLTTMLFNKRHASYGEILVQCSHTREAITYSPYGLPLYILVAQQYSSLEYPDLAAGSAYKALLLSDAVQNEDDEYHERAVDDSSKLINKFASEEERRAFSSRQDETLRHDNDDNALSLLRLVMTGNYCPLM